MVKILKISVILDSLHARKDVDIAAIVTGADDGGSSGELRKNIQQLTPPGDLRNVLGGFVGYASVFTEKKNAQYRFAERRTEYPSWTSLGNDCGISEMQGSAYNAMQLLTKFSTQLADHQSTDTPRRFVRVYQFRK